LNLLQVAHFPGERIDHGLLPRQLRLEGDILLAQLAHFIPQFSRIAAARWSAPEYQAGCPGKQGNSMGRHPRHAGPAKQRVCLAGPFCEFIRE
jgi:hypothetical protein